MCIFFSFLKVTDPCFLFILNQFSKGYNDGENPKSRGVSLRNIWALEDTEAPPQVLWCPACSSSQAHWKGKWRARDAFSSCCSPATGEERWSWNKRMLYLEKDHLNSTISEAITPIMFSLPSPPFRGYALSWLFCLLSFPFTSAFYSCASNQLISCLIYCLCFASPMEALLISHFYFLTILTIP